VDRASLTDLARAGLPLKRIATELHVSISTVRYWLEKYDLEEIRRSNRGAAAHGGRRHVELTCPTHGLTRHVLRGDANCYRCLECRKDAVTRRRQRIKEILVEEAGGCCAICGYDRCVAALQFHHLDPSAKSFGLSKQGVTRSLEAARAEAGKCVCLCSNCHAEVEAGVTAPPSIGSTAGLATAACGPG
jgi:transposase-like protein